MKKIINFFVFCAIVGTYLTYRVETTITRYDPPNLILEEKKRLPETVFIEKSNVPISNHGILEELDICLNFNKCYPQYCQIIQAVDYHRIRPLVLPVLNIQNEGPFNLGQICDVFDYLSDWQYAQDPANEEHYEKASNSWNLQSGDCDDYAICMVAALQAIGGHPVLVIASNGDSGHAYPEINLGNISEETLRDYITKRYDIKSPELITRYNEDGHLFLNLDFGLYPGSRDFDPILGFRFSLVEKTCKSFHS